MNKEIDGKLINDTMAYLQTCPYAQVAGLINRWLMLNQEVPVEPEPDNEDKLKE